MSLLQEMGIEVEGEKSGLPNPTADEYADNGLIKQAIEARKDQFLIDPEKGF